MYKLDLIFHSLFQLWPVINEVQTIFGIRFFQGIIVTVDVLDQYSIIDCDYGIEKHSFHWNRSAVSYSFSCLNRKEFHEIWILIYLIDVVCELSCSQC